MTAGGPIALTQRFLQFQDALLLLQRLVQIGEHAVVVLLLLLRRELPGARQRRCEEVPVLLARELLWWVHLFIAGIGPVVVSWSGGHELAWCSGLVLPAPVGEGTALRGFAPVRLRQF